MSLFSVWLPVVVVASTTFLPSECQDEDKIAGLINQLASDIYKKLSIGEDNVFFSPLSMSTVLAMLYYGARGKTAGEMRRALGYQNAGLSDIEVHSAFQSLIETISKDSAYKKYTLNVANAVFTQKGLPILPEYKNGLREIYKAIASDVDFRNAGSNAVQEINNWVKLKTKGQIDKLLNDVDPNTIMILLNAVYFKGTWKTSFNPRNTMERIFFNKGLRTETSTVPMMYLVEELPYASFSNGRLLELPYKNEDISMVILLPDEIDGLPSLEKRLSPTMIKDIRKRTQKTKVHVTFPKFKLEYKKNLNTVLQELGIKDVFENSADLSGISKFGPIAVSKVVHKAAVEVNEEGSEASAASGVIVEVRTGGTPRHAFNVNHPFLFAIIDRRNDMILFHGRVNKL